MQLRSRNWIIYALFRLRVFILPPPFEIPALMGDFGQWLSDATPGPDSAFEAHARLVTIHPCSDGNGRTARLLMNLLLLKSGYPPVIIGPENRIGYLDTLQLLQVERETAPHRAFLFGRLEESLDRHLTHVKRGALESEPEA